MATTLGMVMLASRRVRNGHGSWVSSVRSMTPVLRSSTRRSPAGAGSTARPVHTGPGSRCWPGPVASYTPAARTIGWAPGAASSTDPRVARPPAPSVNSDSVARRRSGLAPVSHKIHSRSSSNAGTRWRACRRTCSSSNASSPRDPPPACTTPKVRDLAGPRHPRLADRARPANRSRVRGRAAGRAHGDRPERLPGRGRPARYPAAAGSRRRPCPRIRLPAVRRAQQH